MHGHTWLFLLLLLACICESRYIKRAIDSEEESGESNQIFRSGEIEDESDEGFFSNMGSDEYGSYELSEEGETFGG